MNPLQNQQQQQQNQIGPGSVPRSGSQHSCTNGAVINQEVEQGRERTVRDEKRIKVAVPTADGETVELLSAIGSWPFSVRNNHVLMVACVALQPAACL